MAYRIVYVDNADVVAEVPSYDAAYERLVEFLEDHPQLDEEIGIQEVDATGHAVGDMVIGIEVAGQQLQLSN